MYIITAQFGNTDVVVWRLACSGPAIDKSSFTWVGADRLPTQLSLEIAQKWFKFLSTKLDTWERISIVRVP